jgi:predicted ATPase/DNA-binding winged helix-turn-helix (wHTH) protein
VDTDRLELTISGDAVHLEPRVFAVLAHLVANADRVVSKEELLDELWGDRFVSETTLAGNIRAIRAAVGDDGKRQEVIRTVHGRGYRFVAALEPDEGRGPPTEQEAASDTLGNLPLVPGRLIGRSELVQEVVDLLHRARLVSLVGAGGVGKTRIALEVAHRCADQFLDGVWFAMLDTVSDGSAVGRLMLGLLEIDEQAGRDARASLVAGLRSRRCLIVLDNCEHVVDQTAELAASILRSCPDVVLLATSREPLDVDGEQVVRVGPLDVGRSRGGAVELFLERSREAGRTLDPALEGADVARICRLVNGLPLAIELAAARVRSLTPSEIGDRLQDGLAVLKGSRRTGPARHRTLEATLEWSYDLLSTPERLLLRRLSVFRGAFDLAAAEGACSQAPLEPSDMVDVLDHLCLRSLVVLDPAEDRSRYRLLEPVRQFSHDRLVRSGESELVMDAHAEWYAGVLCRADDGWRAGDDQRSWPVARAEMSNIRAAFERFVATGRTDAAQRLAVAAYGPIVMHFDLEPEFNWAPRSCDMEPDRVGPWTARAQAMAAFGAAKRGDLDGATTRARRALDAFAAGSPDDGLLAITLAVLPMFGGPALAPTGFFRQARADALASGDLNRIVWVLSFTGRAMDAIPYARRQGNLVNLALAMRTARMTSQSDVENLGRRELEECLDVAERSNSSTMRNNALLDLALYDLVNGDARRACQALIHLGEDWLRRGDARVWTAVAAVALGLDELGDSDGARAVATSTLGRPLLHHASLPDLRRRTNALRDAPTTLSSGPGGLVADLGPQAEDALAQAKGRLVLVGAVAANDVGRASS